MLVRRIEEFDGGVSIDLQFPDGTCGRLRAQRVLIAAGPISSASIAVASKMVESVRIRDTATAFTAAMALRPEPNSPGLHHGLSQWWIREPDGNFMAQVYAPTSDHAHRLAARLPGGALWMKPATFLTRQIHPVVAYLSMSASDCLLVEPLDGQARVRVQPTESSREKFISSLVTVSRMFRRCGYVMPVKAAELTPAGSGYHMGASMPHGIGSDALGRLPGWRRTHFVDASVIPEIGVGSISPTVMVNALRIARQCVAGVAA
jgi:hypothetical protein